MRVFNGHHPMWKRKENKTNTSSTTTNMVGRRGDLSSPVVLCNESYLENRNGDVKHTNGEKSHTVIVYHT